MTQKAEPLYFSLKFINLILAVSFFSVYKVDSVHEKLGTIHRIHQHVQKFECTKKELFFFIFVEVIKKFMGSVFLGHPVYIYIYIYI